MAYNHWAPFRTGWVLMLIACLGVLLSMFAARKWTYVAAVAAFLGGVLAILIGFGMRSAIAGRAPVTNMYESVLSVGLGTAVFGLIFTVVYRKRMILAAAAANSTLFLLVAMGFDASLQPLMPVLRSNYWLIIHVITVMASFAAFANAWTIGNCAWATTWADRRTRPRRTRWPGSPTGRSLPASSCWKSARSWARCGPTTRGGGFGAGTERGLGPDLPVDLPRRAARGAARVGWATGAWPPFPPSASRWC